MFTVRNDMFIRAINNKQKKQVNTAVQWRIPVFWNVAMRRWESGYRRFERMCLHFPGFKIHNPEALENEGDRVFRNVDNLPRRLNPPRRHHHHCITPFRLCQTPITVRCSSNAHITDTLQVRHCHKADSTSRQQRLSPSAFR
jgi:hypothetical protein